MKTILLLIIFIIPMHAMQQDGSWYEKALKHRDQRLYSNLLDNSARSLVSKINLAILVGGWSVFLKNKEQAKRLYREVMAETQSREEMHSIARYNYAVLLFKEGNKIGDIEKIETARELLRSMSPLRSNCVYEYAQAALHKMTFQEDGAECRAKISLIVPVLDKFSPFFSHQFYGRHTPAANFERYKVIEGYILYYLN